MSVVYQIVVAGDGEAWSRLLASSIQRHWSTATRGRHTAEGGDDG